MNTGHTRQIYLFPQAGSDVDPPVSTVEVSRVAIDGGVNLFPPEPLSNVVILYILIDVQRVVCFN